VNDLLLSKDGTIGKVIVFQQRQKLVVLSSIAILRPGAEVDPQFFGQILKSDLVGGQIDVLTSGSALRRLVLRDIAKLAIPTPSLPEQRRIAEILDTADTAIQQTEALIAKLKLARAGLLHDLLTRGIDEHGRLRDPGAHPEQFKETALGRIPQEWKIAVLSQICDRITDGCHQSVKTVNQGVPFLFVSCIRHGRILWDQAAMVSEATFRDISRGREPKTGVILYTAVGSYGHAALVSEDRAFAFQRHIAYIVPRPSEVNPEFLANWLNGDESRKYAETVAIGNAQKTVTLGALAGYPCLLPPLQEQRQICTRLSQVDARIRVEEESCDKLKLQKQGVMHDVLTGRVRVTPAMEALASSIGIS
jgi:type I restriction enzyme S subunit